MREDNHFYRPYMTESLCRALATLDSSDPTILKFIFKIKDKLNDIDRERHQSLGRPITIPYVEVTKENDYGYDQVKDLDLDDIKKHWEDNEPEPLPKPLTSFGAD